jgi:hypothetical protein
MGRNNDRKKGKSTILPGINNDQLGENASEEFKSESYSNAKPSKKMKK